MDLVLVKNFPDRMYAERARQTLDVEQIPSIIQSMDVGFFGAGAAVPATKRSSMPLPPLGEVG